MYCWSRLLTIYPFALYNLLFDNPIFSSPLDENHEIVLGPSRWQIAAMSRMMLATSMSTTISIVHFAHSLTAEFLRNNDDF